MNIKTLFFRLPEFFFILSLSALLAPGSPSQGTSVKLQENTTTLRVNVDLVLVDVVVLDNKSKPMAGLKKEDFRIFQDDREQPISTFDVVSEEVDKSSLPSSLNDIDERTQRGKVVVLLFDQNTIRGADSKLVLDAAEKYVRQHMHPYDFMAVAVYLQSMKITSPLTHDAAKVIEAIRNANAAGTGSPAVGDTTGAKELRSKVVEVFRSLRNLCSALEPVRGRKTILLFTGDMSAPTDTLTEFNSLVSAARKSDVSFFTLDARGRSATPAGFASTLELSSERPDSSRPERSDPSRRGVNLAQFQNETSATILRSLATQTNGYPVYNTDNLAEALDRVDMELGHYYVLGFQSSNARSDGKPHKIEVKLNVKDAKLSYRDTYTDPHPTDPLAGSKTEDPLRAALSSSAPATQLPVSFRPVYFYESSQIAQIPVFVKIGRGSIALKKKEGQWTGSASIMGVALAEDATTASRFSGEINVAIDNAQAKAFHDQDLIYKNFMRLRPGKYHLKLVVMDEKGKTGTAEENLVIPAFSQGAMAASSLIVSQEMVPLPGLISELKPQMLGQKDPMQFKGFQIYAPVDVAIDRERPFVVFYRIYAAPGSDAQKTFKAMVRAIDEKGESHPFPPVDLASSALPISRTETAVGFMLPTRDLKPGKYHLTVETVEAGSGQSVISDAEFRLR